MGARRCSLDGTSFPASLEFMVCPICGEKTDYIGNVEPDEDWEYKVAMRQEHLLPEAVEPTDIPTVDVKVSLHQGGYTVHAWDLYQAGLRDPLSPFDLIQVGKQVFEAVGYSKSRREYLIRPFSLELSDEELAQLVGADG